MEIQGESCNLSGVYECVKCKRKQACAGGEDFLCRGCKEAEGTLVENTLEIKNVGEECVHTGIYECTNCGARKNYRMGEKITLCNECEYAQSAVLVEYGR